MPVGLLTLMVRMMAPTGYHIIWYFTIINMFKNITDEILLHIYEPSDSTVFFPTLRLICIPIHRVSCVLIDDLGLPSSRFNVALIFNLKKVTLLCRNV